MIHASVQLYKITIHASLTFFNCISNRIFNKDHQLSTILSDFYCNSSTIKVEKIIDCGTLYVDRKAQD